MHREWIARYITATQIVDRDRLCCAREVTLAVWRCAVVGCKTHENHAIGFVDRDCAASEVTLARW
jgi:hypothetical protein